MSTLAERISVELRVLVGHPIVDCWRAANMQIFEFGPQTQIVNRKGEEVKIGELRLHVQCRWRLVDAEKIIFGSDDINYPADDSISLDEFDWDKQPAVLDRAQRRWFSEHQDSPQKVIAVRGDGYGGFQLQLDGGVELQAFPCGSRRGEYSESWRLLGHRADGSHFVVTGDGVEGEDVRVFGIHSDSRRRKTAAMPAAAPLTPTRFAIKMPRPRDGIPIPAFRRLG